MKIKKAKKYLRENNSQLSKSEINNIIQKAINDKHYEMIDVTRNGKTFKRKQLKVTSPKSIKNKIDKMTEFELEKYENTLKRKLIDTDIDNESELNKINLELNYVEKKLKNKKNGSI